MRRRSLLRLYPQRWLQRYEEEIGALVEEGPITLGVVIDVLRGALDAHLHPELVAPSLIASTGGGQVRFVPRSPRGQLLLLAGLSLVALSGWGLAQPLPFVPLILPIGAQTSPEDFARSQAAAGQVVLVSVERDGLAGVLLANASRTEQTLVTAYRTPTLGWFGGGGGKSTGPPPSAERPLGVGYSSGWSVGGVPGVRPHGFISVEGVASEEVSRVVVVFADGTREEAEMNHGAFLWFAGRWDLRAPLRGSGDQADWMQQSFGRAPIAVIAYASDGAEMAREDIGLFR
jgi:hypothetical protein